MIYINITTCEKKYTNIYFNDVDVLNETLKILDSMIGVREIYADIKPIDGFNEDGTRHVEPTVEQPTMTLDRRIFGAF